MVGRINGLYDDVVWAVSHPTMLLGQWDGAMTYPKVTVRADLGVLNWLHHGGPTTLMKWAKICHIILSPLKGVVPQEN
ncbi:hypothetical protein B296_00021463 [Ensete ventricosum]|uniref:Uncharacterized protein n=1 Tax=Ensete ventricosum TaxID=4639 RepID=A0A426YJV9_ENSVE|nr:hypothetical protein B296_00021463 [Ensete ventricosum]